MPDRPEVSKKRHQILTSLSAGAVAGAVAKTTIAPLDRTKINFQVSTRRYSLKAALRFIHDSWKTDGLLTLWRGNSATLARVVPFAAINFASHEQWRKFFHVDVNNSTPGRRYVAGSLAGVTSTICTYPLDMARARLAVTNKQQYRYVTSVFVKIFRQEGFFALYRGLAPTVIGVIPYAGSSFFTYETLKLLHQERTGGRRISAVERLGFGALAGLIGQSASYPLDIVRRRLQTGVGLGSPNQGIVSVLLHVARTEGVRRGLYKGLSMNWFKGPVAAGISFTTFDYVLRFLRLLPYFHEEETRR